MDEKIKNYFERENRIQSFRDSYDLSPRAFDIFLYLGGKGFGPETEGLSYALIGEEISAVRQRKVPFSKQILSFEFTGLWKQGLVDKVLTPKSAKERFVKLTELGLKEYNKISDCL